MDGRWARLGVVLALAGVMAGGGLLRAHRGAAAPADGTYSSFVRELAGRLGVRSEDLGREIQEVAGATLARAVREGRMPAAQARMITEALRGSRWPAPVVSNQPVAVDSLGLIAQTLGLDPSELTLRLRGGQTIAQVAGERGVPVADLRAILLGQLTAQLDREIAAGRFPSERKVEVLVQMGRHVDFFLSAPLKAWGQMIPPAPRQAPDGGGRSL